MCLKLYKINVYNKRLTTLIKLTYESVIISKVEDKNSLQDFHKYLQNINNSTKFILLNYE